MESESKKYNLQKMYISTIGTIINLVLIFILGFTKYGMAIENYIRSMSSDIRISFLIYSIFTIILVLIINGLLSYVSYFLEKKYNLSNESLKGWITKQMKVFLFVILLGVILMGVLYFLLIKTKENWWLYFLIFMLILNIVLGILTPILILPLFYKLTEIKNKKIKEEIDEINRKYNVDIRGIYKFNLSKETKKANALFTGFGKSKRILIADNLLNDFTDEEIISVYLHELGHLKKRHMLKTIITSFSMLSISLFIISKIILLNYLEYINVFKLAFYLSVFQFLTMTVENIFSRKREKEADLFAKKVLGSEDGLISALKKLEKQNLVNKNPNKFVEFLFYSHPSIKKRIKYLIKE